MLLSLRFFGGDCPRRIEQVVQAVESSQVTTDRSPDRDDEAVHRARVFDESLPLEVAREQLDQFWRVSADLFNRLTAFDERGEGVAKVVCSIASLSSSAVGLNTVRSISLPTT